MARCLRVEYRGAIYHTTIRTLGSWRGARQYLFEDDADRERFLEQLRSEFPVLWKDNLLDALLGEAAARAGRAEEAAAILESLIDDSTPFRDWFLLRLARLEAAAGVPDAALERLNRLLADFPRSPWVEPTHRERAEIPRQCPALERSVGGLHDGNQVQVASDSPVSACTGAEIA